METTKSTNQTWFLNCVKETIILVPTYDLILPLDSALEQKCRSCRGHRIIRGIFMQMLPYWSEHDLLHNQGRRRVPLGMHGGKGHFHQSDSTAFDIADLFYWSRRSSLPL